MEVGDERFGLLSERSISLSSNRSLEGLWRSSTPSEFSALVLTGKRFTVS